MIILIAAMNNKRTIGLDGSMPWHNPEDLKHFRKTTLNNKLIMGRKTYEGLPKKLDKRDIYVVSRNLDLPNTIHNLQDYLENVDASDSIYVAGGGEIYRESMKYADKILLSIIEDDTLGDTFFPEIDESKFKLVSTDIFDTFRLNTYERM